MSETKIVTGTIEPMKAEKIRLPVELRQQLESEVEKEVTVEVPVHVPGVFCPQFISREPLVMTQETLDFAYENAKSIVGNMANLPWTPQSGVLLAMAFTILHYHQPKE